MNNWQNLQPTVQSDELEPNQDSKAWNSRLKSAIFVEKYARYYMLSNIANNISELCHLETNELLEKNDRPGDDGTLRSA